MTDRDPHSGVQRLAVIGVGLMGGSLALAAQRGAGVTQIVGYDSDPVAVADSLRMGVVTEIADSPAEAAAGADLDHVGELGHILQVARIHKLGHDRKTHGLPCLGQDLQPFYT